MNKPDTTNRPQTSRKEADNSLFSMFRSNLLNSMFCFVMAAGMGILPLMLGPLRHWWWFFIWGMLLLGHSLWDSLLVFKRYPKGERLEPVFETLMNVTFYVVGSLLVFGALERWFPLD